MLSQAELCAATPQKKRANSPRATKTRVIDVGLTRGGTLKGRVTNGQGVGIENALVTLRKGKREVARVITDKKGNFKVTKLRGGVYRIAGGRGEQVFRLWAAKTAPPTALAKASVVSSRQVVRGQGDILGGLNAGNLLGIGLGATGAVLGGVSLEKTNTLSGR